MATELITAGVDVGSRSTKAVIWDGEQVIGRSEHPTGWDPAAAAETAYREALDRAGGSEPDAVVATGYGRGSVPRAAATVTEITAHARGATRLLPGIRTLFDIGGQDSKVILMEDDGLVADFAMNDRCAAGSGKFLEHLATTMGLEIADFAELAFRSRTPALISSICTVFAETEVLSLLAEGAPREDVAGGVHRSIALRVVQMAQSLHPAPPFAFSGGVALNRCLVRELAAVISSDIAVPPEPVFTGALGAALIAVDYTRA